MWYTWSKEERIETKRENTRIRSHILWISNHSQDNIAPLLLETLVPSRNMKITHKRGCLYTKDSK